MIVEMPLLSREYNILRHGRFGSLTATYQVKNAGMIEGPDGLGKQVI